MMLANILKGALSSLPIMFVGQTYNNPSTGTSVTVDRPSGVQGGDLLIAVCIVGRANPITGQVWTPDSGWTEHFDTYYRSLNTKIATASEPSSYTFSNSLSSGANAVLLLAYRNAVFDQYNESGLADSETTKTQAGLTVPNNSFVFANFSNNGQSSATFSSITSGWDTLNSDTSSPAPVGIDIVKENVSGASGSVSVTSNRSLRSFIWAIRPK
jgi:hypothetical protein